MAMLALNAANPSPGTIVWRSLGWLMGFQCRDGGWAARRKNEAKRERPEPSAGFLKRVRCCLPANGLALPPLLRFYQALFRVLHPA